MASLIIHLYVAQEYLKKHTEILNKEDFLKGSLAPDLEKEKVKAHYGKVTAKPILKDYLMDNGINNDFDKGYFIHLLTDLLFYNYLIDIDYQINKYGLNTWKKLLYDDYDIISTKYVKKLDVEIPECVQKYIVYKDKSLSLFKKEDLDKLVNNISNINIDKLILEIKENSDFNTIEYFKNMK